MTSGRTTAHWVDFLEQVEAWLPPAAERVYAVLDNLGLHRALDVPLVALARPRWASDRISRSPSARRAPGGARSTASRW